MREHLRPFYSETGRPSIDPELMIRMLIVGYCFGIRSERRLCEEVHLNLAYRWFCRLGLDGDVPDHSTFSKNRHGRFRDSDLLRQLFEATVARCMAEGLVGGEGFAVDASLIRADANRQRSCRGQRGLPPDAASRAVREYLAVLDDAAFGGATPVEPKFVSPADPAARWTAANGGPRRSSPTATNYLIDLEHAVIVDVEATTAVRQAEVTAAKRMIERTARPLRPLARAAGRRHRLWLGRDAGLAGPRARDRAAHPGVRQVRAHRRDLLARRLHLRPRGRRLHLPWRQALTRTDRTLRSVNDRRRRLHPLPRQQARLRRLRAEAALLPERRRRARCRARSTKAPATWPATSPRPTPTLISRRERKKVEMLFAHLKRILRLDRLRLRGPSGARDEFLLAATAQNLRKLAKLIGGPRPITA